MDDLRGYVEQFDNESRSAKSSTTFASVSIQMTRHSTRTLRTTAFLLTIALGLMNEVEQYSVAVILILHAVACIVTTLVVFWNNQEAMHSFKQGYKFWLKNFLFLTETSPSSNNQKSDSNYETREYPWYPNNYFNLYIFKLSSSQYNKQLKAKIKESFKRLCMCFFTYIASALLQSHFLFQSLARINETGWHLLDVVRIVFLATTIFELAITVTTYEQYSHEYTVLLYKLDKEVRPRRHTPGPENFRFGLIFLLQLLTITQWICNSTYFLAISGYHMAIYMVFTFFVNYVIIKFIPEVEKPYVHLPFGFHSVPSFWTTRIINSVCSVGTRLHQNSVGHVLRLIAVLGDWRSFLRSFFLLVNQLQVLVVIALYPQGNFIVDIDSNLYSRNFFRNHILVVLMWIRFLHDWLEDICVKIKARNNLEELVRISKCQDHFPLFSGYAFYNMLFEHACDNIVALRTLIITTLSLRRDFYKNYRRLLNDRDFTVQMLRDQYIIEYEVIPDIDSVIHQIEGIRTIKVDEGFPFVLEFDEFMSMILKNENEVEKFNDLRLFCWFYGNFDHNVQHLISDKIIKISEVMGITIKKEDFGDIKNECLFDRWLGFCAR